MQTQKQSELAAAIENRNAIAVWRGDSLFVEGPRNAPPKRRDYVVVTFDDAAEVFGAKVENNHATKKPLFFDRIAFYESLRIGAPEELENFIAECARHNQRADVVAGDTDELWDGAPINEAVANG